MRRNIPSVARSLSSLSLSHSLSLYLFLFDLGRRSASNRARYKNNLFANDPLILIRGLIRSERAALRSII